MVWPWTLTFWPKNVIRSSVSQDAPVTKVWRKSDNRYWRYRGNVVFPVPDGSWRFSWRFLTVSRRFLTAFSMTEIYPFRGPVRSRCGRCGVSWHPCARGQPFLIILCIYRQNNTHRFQYDIGVWNDVVRKWTQHAGQHGTIWQTRPAVIQSTHAARWMSTWDIISHVMFSDDLQHVAVICCRDKRF